MAKATSADAASTIPVESSYALLPVSSPLAPQVALFPRHVRQNFLNLNILNMAQYLQGMGANETGLRRRTMERMMELDLEMSGMLAEMIRIRNCSIDSCVTPLNVHPTPATFEPVITKQSDDIETTPTKDSTVGSADRGQGE